MTRPSSASPTGTDSDAAARDDAVAGPDAGGVAERHRQQVAVAEADDLDRQRRLAGAPRSSHTSPTRARGPSDSTSRPTTRDDAAA